MLYYGLLVVLYLVLSVALPPNHATEAAYKLTTLQYHVLLLLVLFPLAVIWLIAFYGYSNMKAYSELVKDSTEGVSLDHISNGLMWLAWGLPITSLVQLIAGSIANAHTGFDSASVIISNYASIIFLLIAFHIMSTGTRLWTEQYNLRISIGGTKFLVLAFVTIGSIYTYVIFHNTYAHNDPYRLPHWLLITTVVIPYLYSWFMGFLAAYEVSMVSKNVTGLLYQQGLRYVSGGIVTVVASSIVLQYFRTTVIAPGKALPLGSVLLIVYLLLVLIALGYVLLAYGARKLKKIEEV